MDNEIKVFENLSFDERHVIVSSIVKYIKDNYNDTIPEFIISLKDYICLYSEFLNENTLSLVHLKMREDIDNLFQRFIYSLYSDAIPGYFKRVNLETDDGSIKHIMIHQYDKGHLSLTEIKSNVIKELDFLSERFKFKSHMVSSFVNEVYVTTIIYDREETKALSFFG